jgi:hypothetical protein
MEHKPGNERVLGIPSTQATRDKLTRSTTEEGR